MTQQTTSWRLTWTILRSFLLLALIASTAFANAPAKGFRRVRDTADSITLEIGEGTTVQTVIRAYGNEFKLRTGETLTWKQLYNANTQHVLAVCVTKGYFIHQKIGDTFPWDNCPIEQQTIMFIAGTNGYITIQFVPTPEQPPAIAAPSTPPTNPSPQPETVSPQAITPAPAVPVEVAHAPEQIAPNPEPIKPPVAIPHNTQRNAPWSMLFAGALALTILVASLERLWSSTKSRYKLDIDRVRTSLKHVQKENAELTALKVHLVNDQDELRRANEKLEHANAELGAAYDVEVQKTLAQERQLRERLTAQREEAEQMLRLLTDTGAEKKSLEYMINDALTSLGETFGVHFVYKDGDCPRSVQAFCAELKAVLEKPKPVEPPALCPTPKVDPHELYNPDKNTWPGVGTQGRAENSDRASGTSLKAPGIPTDLQQKFSLRAVKR